MEITLNGKDKVSSFKVSKDGNQVNLHLYYEGGNTTMLVINLSKDKIITKQIYPTVCIFKIQTTDYEDITIILHKEEFYAEKVCEHLSVVLDM